MRQGWMIAGGLCVMLTMQVQAQTQMTPSVVAQEKPASMLVLDVSGSMWGQVEGAPKIDIARKVVADLVKDWKPHEDLGLVAYGHRTKGECTDIETIVSVGPVDAAAFMARVNSLSPKGKTPLTAAVIKAAEDLKYTEEPATVILLTDGLETCQADPCAAAKKLEELSVDLTVHVVGFDIKSGEESQLKCIAENTGGKYFTAANASQLKNALVEAAHTPPPPTPAPVVIPSPPAKVQEPAPLPKAMLTPMPTEVVIGSDFTVTWQGPNATYDAVQLVISTTPPMERTVAVSTGNPVKLKAPDKPGVYMLRYVHGPTKTVIGTASMTVKPADVSVLGPPHVNAGSSFEATWTGPKNPQDSITLAPVGAPVNGYTSRHYIEKGSPAKLEAPDKPGSYELRYTTYQGNILLAAPIQVLPVTASIQGPAAAKAGQDIQVTWIGPNNNGDFITIAPIGAAVRGYKAIHYVERGSPAVLKMPLQPGAYELRYNTKRDTILARQAITVQ